MFTRKYDLTRHLKICKIKKEKEKEKEKEEEKEEIKFLKQKVELYDKIREEKEERERLEEEEEEEEEEETDFTKLKKQVDSLEISLIWHRTMIMQLKEEIKTLKEKN